MINAAPKPPSASAVPSSMSIPENFTSSFAGVTAALALAPSQLPVVSTENVQVSFFAAIRRFSRAADCAALCAPDGSVWTSAANAAPARTRVDNLLAMARVCHGARRSRHEEVLTRLQLTAPSGGHDNRAIVGEALV